MRAAVWFGNLAPAIEGRGSEGLVTRVLLCAFLSMGVMVFALAGYGEGLDPDRAAGTVSEGARALGGLQRLLGLALTLPVVHLLGVPLARSVVQGKRWLSADALILCGVSAALASSLWNALVTDGPVWFETVAMVLVLVSVGRLLDARTKERARRALEEIAPGAPTVAHLLQRGEQGTKRVDAEDVGPDELSPGDLILVRPGEEIPADGRVVRGQSFLDTSALTGESKPRPVAEGDAVLASSLAQDGALEIRVEAAVGRRVRDEVERLLHAALDHPPACVRLADRVAGALLPVILIVALGTALWHGSQSGYTAAWQHALAVVLISCPCALGIATPLAFWTATESMWRRGVLVRDPEVFERLARAERVLFDKTGTLVSAELELAEILPIGEATEEEVLQLAAAVEAKSEHPLAEAVRRAWRERGAGELLPMKDFERLPGLGVQALHEGALIRLVRDEGEEDERTRSVLERDGVPLAILAFRSELEPEALKTVNALRPWKPSVLTGDREGAARALSRELDLPVEHGLLPQDKVKRVEEAGPTGVVFVGDGLNDAAALAAADVGVSVSGAAALAMRAGDVALPAGGLRHLPELLEISRSAVRIARGNLFWAFAYNAIGLVLAARGHLTPVLAALAMVASSLFVVLHSSRLRAQGPDSPSLRSRAEGSTQKSVAAEGVSAPTMG